MSVETVNFFGTCDTFFFNSLMNIKLKRTAFIQNKKLFSQYKYLLHLQYKLSSDELYLSHTQLYRV